MMFPPRINLNCYVANSVFSTAHLTPTFLVTFFSSLTVKKDNGKEVKIAISWNMPPTKQEMIKTGKIDLLIASCDMDKPGREEKVLADAKIEGYSDVPLVLMRHYSTGFETRSAAPPSDEFNTIPLFEYDSNVFNQIIEDEDRQYFKDNYTAGFQNLSAVIQSVAQKAFQRQVASESIFTTPLERKQLHLSITANDMQKYNSQKDLLLPQQAPSRFRSIFWRTVKIGIMVVATAIVVGYVTAKLFGIAR